MTEGPHDQPPTRNDEALAERLERLASARHDAAQPSTGGTPARRRSRRHPAARARAAAIGLSVASTAGLTALFTAQSSHATQVGTATIVPAPSTTTSTTTATATSTLDSTSAASRPAAAAPAVVDGAVFQNKWGDVQVEVTFGADGALVSADAIRTPNDRGKSIRINDAAVPRLDAEAVAAQSASIHTVSGATYTSDDYRRSLQSAIDAARAANLTQLT